MTPNLYIIAGPNGAGKTTFANQFLPNYANCKEFVNADYIASGLSPFSPDRVKMGGHNVPEEVVRRRYHKGLVNFGKLYCPLLDFWAIYDNSAEVPKMVAFEKNLKLKVVDNELHDQISQIMSEL